MERKTNSVKRISHIAWCWRCKGMYQWIGLIDDVSDWSGNKTMGEVLI